VCVCVCVCVLGLYQQKNKQKKIEGRDVDSVFLSLVHICMRMPSSPRSVREGSRAGRFPITTHNLCALLMQLEG